MKEREKKEVGGNDGQPLGKGDVSGSSAVDETKDSSGADVPQGSLKHWFIFRVIIAVFGVSVAVIGAWAVFGGIKAVIGGEANLNNDMAKTYVSLQSNYGFFAGVYAAIGIAIVMVAFRFRWAQVLLWLCGIIFCGGVSRLVSMVLWGAPNLLLVLSIILELAVPVAIFVWYLWVKRTDKKSTPVEKSR